MATDPLSSPVDPVDVDAPEPRAERDALRLRAEEAESLAEQLAEQLAEARAQLDDDSLSLFDGPAGDLDPSRAADGSEPGIVPIAFGATAVVALLVALLAWSNTGLLEPITLIMFVVAAGLGRVAWATRVVGSDVSISAGVVSIVRKGVTHRFDLNSPTTRIEMLGSPGDAGWRVRFYRRALDPCDVDASMVDPRAFVRQLREHRPGL